MNTPDITEKIKTPWKRKSRAKPKASLAKLETMPTSSASLDGKNGDNIEYDINENMENDQHESLDNYDKDFLCELNNNQVNEPDEYVAEYEESIPDVKPRKSRAKKNIPVYIEPEPVRTPIYGKTKLVLIKRLQQYKLLFPQLATFHYSNDQDEEELQAVLTEFQSIIQINNQDEFIEESIFQSIRMCEGFSTRTKYDISGLSIILKHNKGFTDILKVLHLKYASYLDVPPEIQACLIISCSVAIVLNKNQNKSSRDSYLDEPINI
jgi:hypothetical protein